MRKHYLQLNTSLSGDTALSARLAAEFVAAQATADRLAGIEVVTQVRDLARDPLPHLTAERFQALTTPAQDRSDAQAAIAAESDLLVAELQAADVVVIGLPMYNFGIPSTLKAYFDHVARAGVTFKYTAQGPQGLLAGKKAVVIATRGGVYSGTPLDLQSAYVRQFLGFIGITDVEFVYAEGLAMGPDAREAAVASATSRIETLAA